MGNLDTTTPMSEFNIVDENGNTTVVPLSANNGLPTGGTIGQVLAKASDANYDTTWIDAPSSSGSGFTEETFTSVVFSEAISRMRELNERLVKILIKFNSSNLPTGHKGIQTVNSDGTVTYTYEADVVQGQLRNNDYIVLFNSSARGTLSSGRMSFLGSYAYLPEGECSLTISATTETSADFYIKLLTYSSTYMKNNVWKSNIYNTLCDEITLYYH